MIKTVLFALLATLAFSQVKLSVHSPLSEHILSFEYACRDQVAFNSCLGNVIWNNRIVLSIAPIDYKINAVAFSVFVTPGVNSLQFEGTGASDSSGLAIDNVKLVRKGSLSNIVINGGFENPNTGSSWSIYDNILGWVGNQIEIGTGVTYNPLWTSQVCELDSYFNTIITQYFQFNNYYEQTPYIPAVSAPATYLYTLEFDWAIRTTDITNTETCKGTILLNNQIIDSLPNPTSTLKINHASYAVKLRKGENRLQFDGSGLSDAYGLTIDNVKLTSATRPSNLISNGDFSVPKLNAGEYVMIAGGISGWSATTGEVGDCQLYNANWPIGQCLELDSDSNQRYTQVVVLA